MITDYMKRRQEHILAGRPLKKTTPHPIAKKSEKRKQKEKEMAGDDTMQRWFESRRKEMTGVCLHCGGKTCKDIVHPFIINLEHGQKGSIHSVAEKFQTQTTAQASGIVTPPFMVIAKGQSKAKAATDPLTTQTGMINHGIVTNDTWNHFITQYYGGSNCTKHITEELGSVTCVDRSGLVSYKEPSIEDCYYRMLKPKEIKLGMAFDQDYVILGNSRDQVKQCGNAVTPPAMEWLVQQCVESLS